MLIIADGIVRFATELLMGGDILTRTISEGFGLSFDEAEELKLMVSTLKNEEGVEIEFRSRPFKLKEIQEALKPPMRRMITEIGRVFTYYEKTDPTRKPVERLILVGGAAMSLGLAQAMEANLQIEVGIGDPFKDLTLKTERPTFKFPVDLGCFFSLAIGLCLKKVYPYVNSIDLLPINVQKELSLLKEREMVKKFTSMSVGSILIALLLLLPIRLLYQFGVSHSAGRLRELRPQLEEAVSLKRENERLLSKLSIFEELSRERSNWSLVLQELSRLIPEKVWLVNLESEEKLTGRETGGTVERIVNVKMTGFALSEEMVKDFLNRLESSPSFSNLELVTLEQARPGRGAPITTVLFYRFEINSRLEL